jgi:hypothetical protein
MWHNFMIKITSKLLMLLSASIIISSCNSGGGGAPGASSSTQPTTAVIKLFAQGTTSSPISGLQATLHLPAGVSAKATAYAPQTDDGVVSATGAASGADLVIGTYSTANHTVAVHLVKSTGLNIGEFATINCDIAQSSSPKASDFSVSDLSAWDTNGAPIAGLTASLTATIK